MPKALVLTKKFADVSEEPLRVLEQAGFEVEVQDHDRVTREQEDEMCRVIQGADVIIVTAMFPRHPQNHRELGQIEDDRHPQRGLRRDRPAGRDRQRRRRDQQPGVQCQLGGRHGHRPHAGRLQADRQEGP